MRPSASEARDKDDAAQEAASRGPECERMSIIVAVRKGRTTIVACDEVQFYGSRRESPTNVDAPPKVRAIGRYLIASAGASIYDTLLWEHVRKRKGRLNLNDEVAILKFFVDFWKGMHKRFHFVNDQREEDRSPFAQFDAEFMVVGRKGMFTIDNDMTVMRFSKYCVIGSGQAYSCGALHALYDTELAAEELAVRSTQAAIHFDEHCGGEVCLFKLPR